MLESFHQSPGHVGSGVVGTLGKTDAEDGPPRFVGTALSRSPESGRPTPSSTGTAGSAEGRLAVAAWEYAPIAARFRERSFSLAAPIGDNSMPSSFSIACARLSTGSDSTIREEIDYYTGNDAETSSILRSLSRFGEDLSIRYFEVTPTPSRRTRQLTPTFTWSVRAVR